MAVYRVGKFYHYDFKYKGTRYKQSTAETSIQRAREVEIAKRKALRNPAPTLKDVSFGDLAKMYLEVHAATKRGKKFYEYSIRVLKRHFAEDRMLSAISPADVDAFKAARPA